MPAALDCPEIESWRLLLADPAAPEQWQRYEHHLESCPICQGRLDRAEECGEPLRQLVQRIGNTNPVSADSTLERFLKQLHEGKGLVRSGIVEPADLYFLRPATDPALLGTLGDYQVQGVIGQGGMGVVLKAFDPTLHRLVAIKVLTAAVAGSALARRRFTREAQAAAAVCHENIVPVHGVHETEGLPYLVMQYVEGESLQARLDRNGPLAVDEVVRIGLQTAQGLAAAHAQGLIHRDITPANILLQKDFTAESAEEERNEEESLSFSSSALSALSAVKSFQVKITDFGLARMVDDVGLTQNGVVAGTPEYMAPEQARGEPIDIRADLFSLGSVLYVLCTGVPPFRGTATLAVLRQVCDQEPTPIRSLNPAVPPWLEKLIARLMAKDPEDRYPSAAEVAAMLEGHLAQMQQPASAPFLAPARGRFLFGLLLLGALGLGLTAWAPGGAEPEPQLRTAFHWDFRLPDQNLQFLSPAEEWPQQDDKGMRITIPAGGAPPRRAGFNTQFAVHGDFEVTTAFEILRADQPTTGYGVGVGLYAPIDPNTRDAVSLSRRVKVNGQAEFIANRMKPVDGQMKFQVVAMPATSPVGQLRLQRVGSQMRFLVADGPEAPFVLLAEVEFGRADLPLVRVEGDPGGSDSGLDLRLLTLSVRTEGVPDGPTEESVGPHRGWGRIWLAAAIFLCLVFLFLAIVGLLVRTSRRTRPSLVLLLGALGGLGTAFWFSWAGDGPAAPQGPVQEYHQPFQGKPADWNSYELRGPNAEDRLHFEPEGLRITLPPGFPGRRPGTGLALPTSVRGDFEIQLHYELLNEPAPADSGDSGITRVSLGVVLDTPEWNDGSVSRAVAPKGGTLFFTYLSLQKEGGDKTEPTMHYFPAREKTGRLRLVRTGSVLSCFAAEGPEGEFTCLKEYPFSPVDLKQVYITTSTAGPRAALDVRVHDLRIRSGPPGNLATAAPTRSMKWVLLAVIAVLLTLALLGVCWRLARRA